jgi:hypothetical protein
VHKDSTSKIAVHGLSILVLVSIPPSVNILKGKTTCITKNNFDFYGGLYNGQHNCICVYIKADL